MKIKDIKINNRFRKDLGDIESLAESIKSIGLLQPIVVDEGNNLVAGFRRIKAFEFLGKEEILEYRINIKDVLKGEYDENTIRKNFTPSESVAIWQAIENYQKTGKERPPSESDEPRNKASKALKISTDTLSKAKQVVDFGNQKLINEMDNTGNVNKVYKKVKSEKRKQELIKKSKEFKDLDDIQVIHGDFRSTDIKEESIDLILTDPPYPEEFLPLWVDLSKKAYEVLKPSGFLIAYSGQMYLPNVIEALTHSLDYYWIMQIGFTKKPVIMGRNIINEWKPILVFQKPPFKKLESTISDKLSFPYTERELHEKNWGQTVEPFEMLLDQFSKAGDTILDPFAGTGTTLVACKNKKRRGIGIEIEKQYVDIIKGRLHG